MKIKDVILKSAGKKKKFKLGEIRKQIKNKFSRQYLTTILNKLIGEGKLIKNGVTNNTFYALPKHKNILHNIIRKKLLNKSLAEHEVLFELEQEAGYFTKLNDNIKSIFEYGFSEMLNNAIEHSRSKTINLELKKVNNNLMFCVKDNGMGVFRSIMKKHNLSNELEAIQDLLKGKTTTMPQSHSGEGIFFTSKTADLFILRSFKHKLIIDNRINDIFVEPTESQHGTEVEFQISLDSKKHLNDIFKAFQSNEKELGFDKTEIKVKLYTFGTIYISRSQARRILSGLQKFKTIVLDFDKVPTVGQAFSDEIFRVFKSKYPNIKVISINMNESVEFMIKRTMSTSH